MWVCDFCQKTMLKRCSILIHIKNHFMANGFFCPFCEASYKSKDSLKKHLNKCKNNTETESLADEEYLFDQDIVSGYRNNPESQNIAIKLGDWQQNDLERTEVAHELEVEDQVKIEENSIDENCADLPNFDATIDNDFTENDQSSQGRKRSRK